MNERDDAQLLYCDMLFKYGHTYQEIEPVVISDERSYRAILFNNIYFTLYKFLSTDENGTFRVWEALEFADSRDNLILKMKERLK
jgi:hypothetical protein